MIFFLSKISLKRRKDKFHVHKAYTAELSDYKVKEQLSIKSKREKQDKSPTHWPTQEWCERKITWDPN